MAIINSCNDSNIVGVTSSICISLRKTIGDLSEGVGISITVSFTLSIVTTIDTTIAKITTVTNSTIARNSTMAIINSCNDSNIVGVTSSICISLRKTIGDLSEGVGISITVSFTLSIVTTIDTTIAKITPVTNSTIA